MCLSHLYFTHYRVFDRRIFVLIQEFDYMTSTHWVGFTFGIAIIFSGLYFLAPADEDNDDSGW